MSAFLHFTYNCMHVLNQYLGTIWPIKVFVGSSRAHPPTADTEQKVLRIFYLLQHKHEIKKFGCSVLDLVSSLPIHEDVLSIYDTKMGYNLLQLAILDNDQELVKALLKFYRKEYWNLCSPPVHLAASLGHVSILKYLLDNGIKSNSQAGICFPDPHQPIKSKRWLGIIDYPVYKCQSNQLFPILWAIAGDHVSCFSLLLQHKDSKGEITQCLVELLHYACGKGANNCIREILTKDSSIVNVLDENRDSPLLRAVVWGRACSKTLIDYGGDVNIVSSAGETALHRLYRNDIDGLFTIYDTTKYLLTTGIEQLINCKNDNGETPIHVLVTHVSYIGGSVIHPDDIQSEIPRPQLQPDYQNQVIKTLDLLLKFNAEPAIQNNHGLDPLSKLMHIAVKSCIPDEHQPDCVKTSIHSDYRYQNDYSHLVSAITVLLHHGSDLTRTCPLGHDALCLMMQCLVNDNLDNLCRQKEALKAAVQKLAESSEIIKTNSSQVVGLLAKIATRFFSIASEDASHYCLMKENYSWIIRELLQSFLNVGLNPNLCSDVESKYLKGGCGNALIEFINLAALAQTSEEFTEIHSWLKTLLVCGADPDLEPYPSKHIICHSQSSIFLKRQGTQAVNYYIDEVKQMENIFSSDNAQDLLMLFYNTMSHRVLYTCLNSSKSFFHPFGETSRTFLGLLNNLSENPRSLKQIARVTIYKSIDRQIAKRVPELPLPTLLKDYLTEIH